MSDEAIRPWEGPWGSRLPPRGQIVVRLLANTANVTLPQKQRMGDAELLAEMLGLSPHYAWRLACDTAIALGFGPTGSMAWRMLAYHEPPGGVWPSAEQWLEAAHLDLDGRHDVPWPAESYAGEGSRTWPGDESATRANQHPEQG